MRSEQFEERAGTPKKQNRTKWAREPPSTKLNEAKDVAALWH